MRKYLTLVLILLIFGSGSIVWYELHDASGQTIHNAALGQGKTDLSALPSEIELYSEGKTLKLPLEDIPEYKNYLLHEEDIQSEIDRTQFVTLDVPSIAEKINLLKYNCGNKDCSTILVKSDGKKNKSLNLPAGIFQDYKLSPDHTKVLIRYAYSEGSQVYKQLAAAIDLQSFQWIGSSSSKLEEQFMLTPTWPIISYYWKDNNHFIIETAALETNEYTALERWFSSEDRNTKKITIKIDASKRLNKYSGAGSQSFE
ncbi:hypothetical protein [Paenibacillus sp. FSL R7-0652]|uniref:hypothetical protein n=1 Tax=Paenibacillus sp. FSL R7-0652 TaxID=2921687 RepID=UPI00315A8D6D